MKGAMYALVLYCKYASLGTGLCIYNHIERSFPLKIAHTCAFDENLIHFFVWKFN